jgi:hypothetical protein
MDIQDTELHVNRCLDSSVHVASETSAPPKKRPRLSTMLSSPAPTAKWRALSTTPTRLSPDTGLNAVEGSDKKPNAFTALMVGHREDKAWKAADKTAKEKVRSL